MSRSSAHLFMVLATVAGAATCGHFQPAAYPLYPGPARPPTEVARLSGPIAKVDGVDVSSQGGLFSLLPGCHVVELQKKIGEGTVSGAWSTELRHATYAFRMKAGSSYEIEVHLQSGNTDSVGNGTVGSVNVEAVERDASGRPVASIRAVRKSADIEACRRWEEENARDEPAARMPGSPDAGAFAERG